MKYPNVTIFKALAVEPRAKIISLLCSRSLCAGAIAHLLEITPGAVSQHLNVLKDCGMVVGEQRGYFMHYRIAPDAKERAQKALDALFSKSVGEIQADPKFTKICSCPKHGKYIDKK